MADQDEDYSSLPLLDRFVHKVFPTVPTTAYITTVLTLVIDADMEGSKAGVRRRHQIV